MMKRFVTLTLMAFMSLPLSYAGTSDGSWNGRSLSDLYERDPYGDWDQDFAEKRELANLIKNDINVYEVTEEMTVRLAALCEHKAKQRKSQELEELSDAELVELIEQDVQKILD